jgi:transcriptional regulator with XRE-family HTH domain
MRNLRIAYGETLAAAAARFSTSAPTLSRLERGASDAAIELIVAYDDAYGGNGILHSLIPWLLEERNGTPPRHSPRPPAANSGTPGDKSILVSETPGDGARFEPGEHFTKTWILRNAGTVPWIERQLVRDTVVTATGPFGPRSVPIPRTEPGQQVSITVDLQAGDLPGAAQQWWYMRNADGSLCYPNRSAQGVWVAIEVIGDRSTV